MEYTLGNTPTAPLFNGAIKLTTFVSAGSAASFLLFALMSELIKSENPDVPDTAPVIPVELHATAEEKNVIEKVRDLPEPPKPVTPPKRDPQPKSEETSQMLDLSPGVGVKIPGPKLEKIDFDGPRDNNAMPIVRVQPQYPLKAARDGIEGWVSLSFSISPTGRVINIQVVDSHPRRLFDKEARKALKKWKYKPQIKDGKAITVEGQTIVLDFTLDQREA